jgi:tyrosyl-tRNA synthetase
MPLLEGLDGVNKMSKSLGNYVGITDEPDEMFGKLMSVSDDLMWRYFELLSFRPLGEIEELRSQVGAGANPRDAKFELASEIVSRFHSPEIADKAKNSFISRFKDGAMPDHIEEVTVQATRGNIGVAHLLRQAQLVSSTSEAFRMIKQGAVRIDGERIVDRALEIPAGTTHIYQVGKRRFARVTVA